ncbi:MAG: hypothetical protein ACC663_08705 [Gammaproteobacteria bacterium]
MTKPGSVSNARVIQLSQLTEADDFPAYVAIYSEQAAANPFALSPTVMQWSDRILLCRVVDCEQFWLTQKQKYACDLEQLFDPILRYHHGAGYIAVFANHPWQCLVYLCFQMHQQARGIYFLQSLLNRNIYQLLEWEFWFAPQEALITHLEASRARRFNAASFRARQAQLRRFISRTGLAGPFALKQADYQAMARRFDVWAGKIWCWTFATASDLEGFPWVALAQAQRPMVSRELEYPLNQWCYIEALLREDFERLCEQFRCNESEHINRILWQITLFNYQKISVELSFRHPYSLHRELPAFKTALYQAWYVYDDLMQKLQARDKDLDLPEAMPFIAWRVEICERIHLPPILWDLFSDAGADIRLQDLRELQNKLPVAVETYHCEASFYPEQSFGAVSPGAVAEPPFDYYQWSSSSTYRPLFYYQTPTEIEAPTINPGIFLERCASRWWLDENPERQNRDYYVLKDTRGRASWVYRDGDGKWFKQGEYF